MPDLIATCDIITFPPSLTFRIIYGVVIGIPVGNEPSWFSWSNFIGIVLLGIVISSCTPLSYVGWGLWVGVREERRRRRWIGRQVRGVSSIVEGIHERGGGS